MGDLNNRDLLLEKWKLASELHRHEDNEAWHKFNYFVGLNGVLLSVLVVVWSGPDSGYDKTKVLMSLLISLFGALVSLVWVFIQKRGQLYQHYRIAQAKEAERALTIDGVQVLDVYARDLNEQELVPIPTFGRLSTYVLVFYLAVFTLATWILLLGWFSIGFLRT
jgi:hypothetical protein